MIVLVRAGPAATPVQAQPGRDFTLPAPREPAPTAPAAPVPAAPVPAAPGTQTAAQAGANPFAGLGQAPTGTEIALGAGALLVLAALFLFVRRGVRAHLIGRRAAIDAADGASWMLFSALMLTAAILVTATVGRLWEATAGLLAGFGLCLVLFGAALLLFLRAPERRR
ncbi:hypothetical protein Q8W71_20975 [Methylobacterium sp. NEAU 140]|uniref:hypothetical protein n=1 Tax=Methylobacterium sp. NEAU 140 TaxID=3064945 RepID=UPI0027370249|nr:hypothetical protein [Methylobacterium sp. NEAU 140]MDP4025107.1 hypothetical protein [Methylobacterium sp. NEAU 140]